MLNLVFNFVCDSNDAAGNSFALTFSETTFTIGGCRFFRLIEIILSFIDNHGASNNRVDSPHAQELISVLVLGLSIETSLNVLNITATALVNIEVRVTVRAAEGVVDFTC